MDGRAYLGSLFLFFVSSFWTVDSFSGNVVTTFSLDNYVEILTGEVYRTIAVRTVVMASLVTVTTILIALPDRVLHGADRLAAHPRDARRRRSCCRCGPGYLVKVYAWRLILSQGGVAQRGARAVRPRGAGLRRGRGLARRDVPLAAVHDHPDLRGARARARARCSRPRPTWAAGPARPSAASILPLVLPAVVAGSIFTFSLTLGDYITPTLVSNTPFIGNVIYDLLGVAGNLPLAAAYAMVPVAIMTVYLLLARRLGAFEAL